MLPIKLETVKLQDIVADQDVTEDLLTLVQNEAFCPQQKSKGAQDQDICQVYIDHEIEGLSFAFIQLTVSGSSEKLADPAGNESLMASTKVLFSYDSSDYFDLMDNLGKTYKMWKSKIMDRSASI